MNRSVTVTAKVTDFPRSFEAHASRSSDATSIAPRRGAAPRSHPAWCRRRLSARFLACTPRRTGAVALSLPLLRPRASRPLSIRCSSCISCSLSTLIWGAACTAHVGTEGSSAPRLEFPSDRGCRHRLSKRQRTCRYLRCTYWRRGLRTQRRSRPSDLSILGPSTAQRLQTGS